MTQIAALETQPLKNGAQRSADWSVKNKQWWNRERGTRNTFHRDGSGAARHAKLVSRHAGVETGVRLGCIPYPKVAVVQNGDPVDEHIYGIITKFCLLPPPFGVIMQKLKKYTSPVARYIIESRQSCLNLMGHVNWFNKILKVTDSHNEQWSCTTLTPDLHQLRLCSDSAPSRQQSWQDSFLVTVCVHTGYRCSASLVRHSSGDPEPSG